MLRRLQQPLTKAIQRRMIPPFLRRTQEIAALQRNRQVERCHHAAGGQFVAHQAALQHGHAHIRAHRLDQDRDLVETCG
ncbi:hypothetical protein D3C72_2302010 [compost metagenome]